MKILVLILAMSSYKSLPTHQLNPFKRLGIETIQILAGMSEKLMVDPETAEAYAMRKMTMSGAQKRKDGLAFRKIYFEALEVMRDLNPPAVKILCYILTNMTPGTDEIHLSFSQVREWCGFSASQSYYTGITDLVEKRIVAKSQEHNKFFINTNYFFNGDRTSKDKY